MNNNKLSTLLLSAMPVLLSMPAHSALLTGTRLTIDQGSGDCHYNTTFGYSCTNLAGSYMMAGWSNGSLPYPQGVAFLGDGYDDTTGAFTGGSTAGAGLVIGVAQPYQGAPVGPGTPYDPATGQNITSAFQLYSGGYLITDTWGTFYSTSPLLDNGDGTLDFSGWDAAFGESPALFGGMPNGYPPGNAVLTLIPGGGAYSAGRYTIDYFTENCSGGNFECQGFLLHLEGSISPVPLPAAAWLFGAGLLGLLSIARHKTV